MTDDKPRRLSISEDYLGDVLGQLELRLVRELQEVKEAIPTEDRIRHLAREELGLVSSGRISARGLMASAGMLLIAASTFLLTVFRGGHHP